MAGRRRYPKYDWSGIAMLTQQLGQLFEPSKAKIQHKAQEHEMRMLQAKQAWEFGEEQLEVNKEKYNKLLMNIEAEKLKLATYGPKVMEASMKDGATPDTTSKIHNDVDVRKLSDLNDLAGVWHDKSVTLQAQLDDMKNMNVHAIAGKNFRSGNMQSKDASGEVKDYYKEADKDGITGLSFEEGQNAVKRYIQDNYAVAEGEDSVEVTFGSGKKAETILARPEAIAYRAGFEADVGAMTGRGKKADDLRQKKKGLVEKDKGRPDPSKMTDPHVIEVFNQNNDRIIQLNTPRERGGKSLDEHLGLNQYGEYFAEKSAKEKGWTDAEIADFVVSMNVRKRAMTEIRLRPNLDIPVEKLNIKHPLSYTINEAENPSTTKMFEKAKISSDILYAKMLMKEDDDRYMAMITAYQEIMKGDAANPDDDRQAALNVILDWVNR